MSFIILLYFLIPYLRILRIDGSFGTEKVSIPFCFALTGIVALDCVVISRDIMKLI